MVLEVASEEICQTGWDEEPELQWDEDKRAALEPCLRLKHTFARIARDCSDAVFLAISVRVWDKDRSRGLCLNGVCMPHSDQPSCCKPGSRLLVVLRSAMSSPTLGSMSPLSGSLLRPALLPSLPIQADDPKSKELVEELQVKTIPTVQFIKNKQLLWEHKGINKLEQNLSEGVLYYGDQAAENLKASSFVKDLHSPEEFQEFVKSQDKDVRRRGRGGWGVAAALFRVACVEGSSGSHVPRPGMRASVPIRCHPPPCMGCWLHPQPHVPVSWTLDDHTSNPALHATNL